jgi:ABC-2 type transport system ATP-binding protein
MQAIEVRGLSKSFGKVAAVEELTFEVSAGKVTGFLGPNGAGKSTTLKMIVGLITPDSGVALVEGMPYGDRPGPLHQIGSLLDADQFHPRRSGRNHLRAVARAAGISDARVDEVLQMVGLTDAARRKVGGYSLGMRQRLGLAGALLGDPDILILDEPANGLDPAGIRWLRSFLRGFVAEGKTVLVSSHLLAEITEVADEVVVISEGRLITHSPIAELLRHSDRVRVSSPQADRLRDLLAEAGVPVELIAPDLLSVRGSREKVGEIAADAGLPIFGLETDQVNLEDVFLELTGSKGVAE